MNLLSNLNIYGSTVDATEVDLVGQIYELDQHNLELGQLIGQVRLN